MLYFNVFLGRVPVVVQLKNDYGFFVRYLKRKPVAVSFISDKPEDAEMRYRANLFMFFPWRRESSRQVDVSSVRYEELDLILKRGFESFKMSWEDYISQHKDAEWTRQYYASEAIRKAKVLGDMIAKEVAEHNDKNEEGHNSSEQDGRYFSVSCEFLFKSCFLCVVQENYIEWEKPKGKRKLGLG